MTENNDSEASDPADSSSDATPSPSGKLASAGRRLGSTVLLWGLLIGAMISQIHGLIIALFAFIAVVATIEFFQMLGRAAGGFRYSVLGVGIAYILAVCWISATTKAPHPEAFDVGMLTLGAIGGLAPFFWSKPEGHKTLLRLMGSIFGLIYIPFLISFMPRVLVLPGALGEGSGSGWFYLLFLIMVTKFTDMGAYLVGTLFGKHKMSPAISPGKTWQGFFGALVFAVAAAVSLSLLLPENMPLIRPGTAVVLGLLLGFLAVLGDLAESVLKRCLESKDSGGVLPGIGGMLDLVDSLLFTAPALYFYLRYVAA